MFIMKWFRLFLFYFAHFKWVHNNSKNKDHIHGEIMSWKCHLLNLIYRCIKMNKNTHFIALDCSLLQIILLREDGHMHSEMRVENTILCVFSIERALLSSKIKILCFFHIIEFWCSFAFNRQNVDLCENFPTLSKLNSN